MTNEKPVKVYVPVQAVFSPDGRMLPRALRWEDGVVYTIDRVLDIRPAGAAKAGGHGDRYTVRIGGQETYLFFEHNVDTEDARIGKWFVERREERRTP